MDENLTPQEIEVNEFNACTAANATELGYEIECLLGLWSVSCFGFGGTLGLTQEAIYYWLQYKSDGEYYKIIGGKSPIELLTKK
tara:strand:+ start:783 stop:1034 length:252 start_codon:yes stop_codon:yes gene_type:complete